MRGSALQSLIEDLKILIVREGAEARPRSIDEILRRVAAHRATGSRPNVDGPDLE